MWFWKLHSRFFHVTWGFWSHSTWTRLWTRVWAATVKGGWTTDSPWAEEQRAVVQRRQRHSYEDLPDAWQAGRRAWAELRWGLGTDSRQPPSGIWAIFTPFYRRPWAAGTWKPEVAKGGILSAVLSYEFYNPGLRRVITEAPRAQSNANAQSNSIANLLGCLRGSCFSRWGTRDSA